MRRFNGEITGWTSEISKSLAGRTDVSDHRGALLKALNVRRTLQGNLERRPGTRTMFAMAYNEETEFRAVPFKFSNNDSYVLFFHHDGGSNKGVIVFRNGEFFSDRLNLPAVFTRDVIAAMNFTEFNDAVFFAHPDIPPHILQRTNEGRGLDIRSWLFRAIDFSDPEGSLPRARINKTKANGQPTTWSYDSDEFLFGRPRSVGSPINPITTAQKVSIAGSRTDTGFGEIIAYRDGSDPTVVSNQFTFPQEMVGQIIVSTDGGLRARVIGIRDSSPDSGQSVLQVYFERGFPLPNIVGQLAVYTSGQWHFEYGYEESWGSLVGYPGAVEVHENRLVFAGSRTDPTGVWMSAIARPFIFDFFSVEDDAPIYQQLSLPNLNRITGLFSSNRLAVLTRDSIIWLYSGDNESGITPSNITSGVVRGLGISPTHAPFLADNSVSFLTDGGKSVAQIFYNNETRSYERINLSLLTPHFLESGVRSLSVVQTNNPSTGDTIYMANGDGDIALLQVVESEQIISGVRWNIPDGIVRSVLVDNDDLYAVVEQTLLDNNQIPSKFFLFEIFVDECFLDHENLFVRNSQGNIIAGYSAPESHTPNAFVHGIQHTDIQDWLTYGRVRSDGENALWLGAFDTDIPGTAAVPGTPAVPGTAFVPAIPDYYFTIGEDSKIIRYGLGFLPIEITGAQPQISGLATIGRNLYGIRNGGLDYITQYDENGNVVAERFIDLPTAFWQNLTTDETNFYSINDLFRGFGGTADVSTLHKITPDGTVSQIMRLTPRVSYTSMAWFSNGIIYLYEGQFGGHSRGHTRLIGPERLEDNYLRQVDISAGTNVGVGRLFGNDESIFGMTAKDGGVLTLWKYVRDPNPGFGSDLTGTTYFVDNIRGFDGQFVEGNRADRITGPQGANSIAFMRGRRETAGRPSIPAVPEIPSVPVIPVQQGRRFKCEIETAPISVGGERAALLAQRKKRVSRIFLEPVEAYDFEVNGERQKEIVEAPELVDVLSSSSHLVRKQLKGFREFHGQGFERYATLKITSEYPIKIGSVSYIIEVASS